MVSFSRLTWWNSLHSVPCEPRTLFALPPLDGSVLGLRSCPHMHAQCSAVYSKEPPWISGVLSLSSSLPWGFCCKYSGCFCVPALSASSPQLSRSTRSHLSSPALCCCCLETSKAVSSGTCRTHCICSPSAKEHCLSLLNIQCLANHCFFFVCLFLVWLVSGLICCFIYLVV